MHDVRFVDQEPIEGTTSVVRVWDAQFSLPRASRTLADLPAEDWDEARERVRTLSRLRHPALPQLVAIGEHDESLKLVEAWVEGRSLEALVGEGGPMAFEPALGLLSPIVDALALAHSMGIAHGGVDGHSIMVDQVGSAMLVGTGARTAELQHDVADLALLLSEVVQSPLPEALDQLIEAAMGDEVVDMATFSSRLSQVSLDSDESDVSSLDMDFDFQPDLSFDGDDEPYVAQSRTGAMLVAVAVAIVVVAGLAMLLVPGSIEETLGEEIALGEGSEAAEPDPEDDAQGMATRGGLGKWQVVQDAGQTARVVVEANNDVTDRNSRGGRPALSLACVEGELQAVLEPGVHRVEAVAEEGTYALYAELSVSNDGVTQRPLRGSLKHGDSRVVLPNPRKLLALFRDAHPLSVAFAPFASKPVLATFDVYGAGSALAALQGCR